MLANELHNPLRDIQLQQDEQEDRGNGKRGDADPPVIATVAAGNFLFFLIDQGMIILHAHLTF